MEEQALNKLMSHFRKGDERAFEKVFDQFYRPLTLFAQAMIQNQGEAEDIAVTTMSKLWKIHQNFDTITNVRAFLYITVRNQCLNFLTKEKRDIRDEKLLKYFIKDDSEEYVLSRMVRQEVFEQIRNEINSLSPQRRQVIIMSFFQNMTAQEIAEKMNLSLNTIRATKAGGIRQLRELLIKKKMLALAALLYLIPLTD